MMRRFSTFWAWTGSLCTGVPSAVGSGKVQRAFAPGLAYMMSSTSGPGRLEAKGTLKDRFTWVPGGMTGGAEVAVDGRLMGAVTGMSWFDLVKGKPAEGAIFSQPCRAWPVKLDILCITGESALGCVGRRVMGEESEEDTREVEARPEADENGPLN